MTAKREEKPARYTKRPVTVEAVRFTGKNFPTINKFVGKIFPKMDGEMHWGFRPALRHHKLGPEIQALVWDKLHETWVGVKDGQWIIKGVEGEFYPCDDSVFTNTYMKENGDAVR